MPLKIIAMKVSEVHTFPDSLDQNTLLITLIIILPQQWLQMLCMKQECHYSSIPAMGGHEHREHRVILYNRTSSNVRIDEARQELFTIKGWAMMQFPQLELPSCNALEGLYTKVDTAGARCCKLQLGCHQLGTGDGSIPATGGQSGPLYPRLVLLLEIDSMCLQEVHVLGAASTRRQH